MKSFFENPEWLLGLPILLIGLAGAALALGVLGAPEKTSGQVVHRGHPDDMEYIKVGITLAVITAIEVALFYIDVERNLLIGLLVVLSAAKFFIVVSWFMHLRFDSRLFTTAFVTGLVLAGAVFTVVLVTLNSNFV